MKKSNAIFNTIGYFVITVLCLICILPFIIIISSSFSAEKSIIKYGYSIIPRDFTFNAYKTLFEFPANIINAYKVTIIVTVVGTLLSLFLTAMTAYVLSRKDFTWRNKFSFFFYFTMLFNGGLVPWYILCMRYLHFNQHPIVAMIVPYLFSVFNLLILKNFMKDIPESIIESAKMDGAGNFKIFVRLAIPLAKPAIATIGLFTALTYWNDWYLCYLYVSDPNYNSLQYYLYRTLSAQQVLQHLVSSSGIKISQIPTETMKMAMVIIATGPILVVYPFLQKYFVRGLTVGGVKG